MPRYSSDEEDDRKKKGRKGRDDDSEEEDDRRGKGGRSKDADKKKGKGKGDDSDEDLKEKGKKALKKGLGGKDKKKGKGKGLGDESDSDKDSSASSSDEDPKNKFSKKNKGGGRSGPQQGPGSNLWYFQNDPSLAKACQNARLQFPTDYQPYSKNDSEAIAAAYNAGRDCADLGPWIIYFNQTVDSDSEPRRLIPAPGEHVQVRQGTATPFEKFRAVTMPQNWTPQTAYVQPNYGYQPPQQTVPRQAGNFFATQMTQPSTMYQTYAPGPTTYTGLPFANAPGRFPPTTVYPGPGWGYGGPRGFAPPATMHPGYGHPW
eukprot:TRINITY_DN53127_c0_g1_i1.p1 TRINITY_DN53127_c0_g1~~TRINITY_DN53127_c0_g1_i1.p1  ORF type:complete len:317 (+),score=64.70 TRINITY_DN53127_c0_g1_i1:33-983(+)